MGENGEKNPKFSSQNDVVLERAAPIEVKNNNNKKKLVHTRYVPMRIQTYTRTRYVPDTCTSLFLG